MCPTCLQKEEKYSLIDANIIGTAEKPYQQAYLYYEEILEMYTRTVQNGTCSLQHAFSNICST